MAPQSHRAISSLRQELCAANFRPAFCHQVASGQWTLAGGEVAAEEEKVPFRATFQSLSSHFLHTTGGYCCTGRRWALLALIWSGNQLLIGRSIE